MHGLKNEYITRLHPSLLFAIDMVAASTIDFLLIELFHLIAYPEYPIQTSFFPLYG